MSNSGDGWAQGPDGTRMWGLYGAAGLVAYDPALGILLQACSVGRGYCLRGERLTCRPG